MINLRQAALAFRAQSRRALAHSECHSSHGGLTFGEGSPAPEGREEGEIAIHSPMRDTVGEHDVQESHKKEHPVVTSKENILSVF